MKPLNILIYKAQPNGRSELSHMVPKNKSPQISDGRAEIS